MSAPPASPGQAHPLARPRVESDGSLAWELELSLAELPYLAEHGIYDWPVVPAALYVELALAVSRLVAPRWPAAARDIRFERALFLDQDAPVKLCCTAVPGVGAYALRIALADGEPVASAEVGVSADADLVAHQVVAQARRRCRQHIAGAEYYQLVGGLGGTYGPSFQGLDGLWRGEAEAVGRIRAPAAVAAELPLYAFHPAFLDACLHVPLACVGSGLGDDGLYLPVGIDRVVLRRAPAPELWCHARLTSPAADTRSVSADAGVFDPRGRIVLEVAGLRGLGGRRAARR
jgi:acyl transferase domain-containing protein